MMTKVNKVLGIIFLLGIVVSICFDKLSLNWFNVFVCIFIGYIFINKYIYKFELWFDKKNRKNIYERRIQKTTLEILNIILILVFLVSFFVNLYYPNDIILLLSLYSIINILIIKIIRYILLLSYNIKNKKKPVK